MKSKIKTETDKRNILLKDIPDDIFDMIIREQNRVREERKIIQFSLSETIFLMLRNNKKKWTWPSPSLIITVWRCSSAPLIK